MEGGGGGLSGARPFLRAPLPATRADKSHSLRLIKSNLKFGLCLFLCSSSHCGQSPWRNLSGSVSGRTKRWTRREKAMRLWQQMWILQLLRVKHTQSSTRQELPSWESRNTWTNTQVHLFPAWLYEAGPEKKTLIKPGLIKDNLFQGGLTLR